MRARATGDRRCLRTRGLILGLLAVTLVAGAVWLLGCAGDEPATTAAPPTTTSATTAGGSGAAPTTTSQNRPDTPAQPATAGDLAVSVVATGLEVPWEVRFLPSGDLLVTERPGRIRLIPASGGQGTVVGTLPVAAVGEGGLMGLALDPDFPEQPYLYVFYTYSAADQLRNRISRLTYTDGRAGEERVLLEDIPGAGNHDGGRLAFGPDGYLWAGTGDAAEPSLAQDPASLAGKVLRLDREGRPAPDNPDPDSPVFTLGHRNPQGIDWQPGTDVPFITEHGPSDNDEVNRLEAGGNYGWPDLRGKTGQEGFVDPIITWTPTIAPAGTTFYDADLIPGWRGSLLFTTLKDQTLHRLVPEDQAFTSVAEDVRLFDEEFGRLRAVRLGPDGALYLLTSNRDGRGDPVADDDRVLRVAPR